MPQDVRALEAGAEIAGTLQVCGATIPANRLLIVALEDVDTPGYSAVANQSMVYRLLEHPVRVQAPEKMYAYHPADPARDPWLPFPDRVFDVVVLYRAMSQYVDIQLLLGEAERVLQSRGVVIVIAHEMDFSFAPIPDSGRTHLLRRWLREAGFGDAAFLPSDHSRVVAVAHAGPVKAEGKRGA